MQEKNLSNTVTWILDECVTPDKSNWKILYKKETVLSVSDLNLLSTKDAVISDTLNNSFPNGFVIITKNLHEDKKGDYFKKLPNQGIVKISGKIPSKKEQKEVFEKFRRMFKNFDKIIGATILLGKSNIIYTKGSKTKVIPYNKFI